MRQSLSDRCCTVEDLQNMLKNDSHMADNIVHFGEGLRSSHQFWYRRSSELSDMIKQLSSRDLIFFTFSATNFH